MKRYYTFYIFRLQQFLKFGEVAYIGTIKYADYFRKQEMISIVFTWGDKLLDKKISFILMKESITRFEREILPFIFSGGFLKCRSFYRTDFSTSILDNGKFLQVEFWTYICCPTFFMEEGLSFSWLWRYHFTRILLEQMLI